MTAQALEACGFQGFVRFQDLRESALATVPRTEGTYVVLGQSLPPVFVPESCGGHFKGRNPTVALAVLEAKWVAGTEVLYIGKANNLQRRLRQYADFGAGRPVGHWGGRFIWQLADSNSLLVAWMRSPQGEMPQVLEADLVAAFKTEHQRLPFANIADPSA